MKLVTVWIAAIISMLVVSVYYLALKPANDMLIDSLNTTMRPHAVGTAATGVYNLVSTVWGLAFSIWLVVTLLALLLWAYMKMQEREVITEAYY